MIIDVGKITKCLILFINGLAIATGINILATGRTANIFFMGCLCLFYTVFVMRKIRLVSSIQILWGIWFLFMLWNCNTSYTRSLSMKYYIVNFIPFLLLLLLEVRCSDCRKILSIVRLLCIVYAFSIIISLIFKDKIVDLYSMLMAGGNPAVAANKIRDELAIGSYSGLVGEKGFAALYMNFGIGIELSELCRKKRLRKENLCLLFLYFIALLLASKRTFFVIAVVQCILAVCLFDNIKNKIKNVLAGIQMGIPCLIAAFILVPQLGNLFQRFRAGMEDPTMMGRTAFWGFCLKMFQMKPKFGFGFGSFNDVYTDITHYLYKGEPWTYHAHNVYLQLLGETGIVGFLLFMIPAISSLIMAFAVFKSVKESGERKQIAYMGLYLQILFLAYGVTGNFVYLDSEFLAYFTGVLFTFTAMRERIRDKNDKGAVYNG